MKSVLYRDLAMIDPESRSLSRGLSILVQDQRISWIRPRDSEEDPGADIELIDAGGTTAVPGMVDSHSHLTMPGGSHWIERGRDRTETLLQVAEDNARLLRQAGVRWARDVGAPMRDGRALSLTVRDSWRGRPGYPHVRAAGSWIMSRDTLPDGGSVEVEDGDQLAAAGEQQLDQGADLLKLYMDGPDRDTAPFTASEVSRMVVAASARGAKVTAHSSTLHGARAAVEGGVAAIEHGFQLDEELVQLMAQKGVALVSTLAVMESWKSFAGTTELPRFTSAEARSAIAARQERAQHSVRLAHRAGVLIATGTDFGGGSLRANQLAWEIESLVAAGISPFDAIEAATRNGGELLSEPEAGRLFEGGPADFVLVHGDPLSDPQAMWRVWRVSW